MVDFMIDPVRIGSLIHRNRALLAQIDEQLVEIAGMMPHVEPANRRPLRQIAREARRTRMKIRFVAWMLQLLDPR
jgi:hypothetical protein